MAEALKQRNLPASIDKPVEEEPSVTPTHAHLHNVKPVYRFTPRHNGSTLLDSYELRAVTNQLNKAMQGLNGSSTTLLSCLKSPFYNNIYIESTKSPRRITCSRFTGRCLEKKPSRIHTRAASGGFVSKLWNRVKQGLLRSKQKNQG